MTASPDSADPLFHAKLEAMAELAAGAGHEINNPLATISGHAQRLLLDEADPDRRQALLAIGAQAYRIRDMIGDLMLFARPPVPVPQAVKVREALESVFAALRPGLPPTLALELAKGREYEIWADPTQFAVVASNLMRNAVEAHSLKAVGDAAAAPGTLRVGCKTQGEMALLTFTDGGCGFTPDELQHAFDPFFSARQAGRGLGFGLPKCWRIVTGHGGRIAITSLANPTVVSVWWPLAASRRTQPSSVLE